MFIDESIIFIKSGSFYEVFDKDSMILNNIFYYKVKRIKDNIKTGFPINKLEHIIKLMGNINYIVIGIFCYVAATSMQINLT